MINSARFFSQIFQLYKQGEYAAALDLAILEGDQFVHDTPRVYHPGERLAKAQCCVVVPENRSR